MFVNTLSNSKKETFDQCKLKYKYNYIDKLKGDPGDESAMNFGSYIHKILEEGYNSDSLDHLLKLAEQHKPTYKIPYRYSEKTEKCLKNFLKFNKNLGETVGCELKYEVEIAPGMTVNGVIDRIIKGKDGGLLVIDYKTSKREKTKIDLFDDSQLQGYTFACHKEFGVPIEDITCAHYYPVTNNLVPIKYGRKKILRWVKNTVDKIWEMRKIKMNELTSSRNSFCDWCNYKAGCDQFESDPGARQRIVESWEPKPPYGG